jgi:hypothetical protein
MVVVRHSPDLGCDSAAISGVFGTCNAPLDQIIRLTKGIVFAWVLGALWFSWWIKMHPAG